MLLGQRGVRGGEDFCEGALATEVALEYPHDLLLSPSGRTLYVCEVYAVRAVDLSSVPPRVSTVVRSDFGLGGIAFSHGGTKLLVSQHSRHQIVEVDLMSPQQKDAFEVLVGTGEPGPLQSGVPALQARLNNPSKLASTKTGDVVFVDSGNRSLRFFERATGIVRTLSDAADAPDGLAVCPSGTVLVSEGRSHQVLQFSQPDFDDDDGFTGDAGFIQREWIWSACLGTGDEPEESDGDACGLASAVPALQARIRRPQGLSWAPGLGLLVCDSSSRAVLLVRALTPWSWRGPLVLLRALVERDRSALRPPLSHPHGDPALSAVLSILVRLPDEEFREVLSWWWEA